MGVKRNSVLGVKWKSILGDKKWNSVLGAKQNNVLVGWGGVGGGGGWQDKTEFNFRG